jgi:hypothetical protein
MLWIGQRAGTIQKIQVIGNLETALDRGYQVGYNLRGATDPRGVIHDAGAPIPILTHRYWGRDVSGERWSEQDGRIDTGKKRTFVL